MGSRTGICLDSSAGEDSQAREDLVVQSKTRMGSRGPLEDPGGPLLSEDSWFEEPTSKLIGAVHVAYSSLKKTHDSNCGDTGGLRQ